MHLNTYKFAIAAAVTMGVVYAVCSVFVALFPVESAILMSWLTHVTRLESRSLTWISFFGGLVQVALYSYVFAYLFGWLFNKFSTK